MYYENDWLLCQSDFISKVEFSQQTNRIVMSNSLITREFTLCPDFATVNILNETTAEAFSRGVKPELLLTIDGHQYSVGGASGQPDYAYLKEDWIGDLAKNTDGFNYVSHRVYKAEKPLSWNKNKRHNTAYPRFGNALGLAVTFESSNPSLSGLRVTIYYEMYDNIPLMSKRFEIVNNGDKSILLDSFVGEIIALTEHEHVGSEAYRAYNGYTNARNITVTSNFANVLTNTTFFEVDPDYSTQVDYMSQYKCLLVSKPPLGPHRQLDKGQSFESFTTYTLLHEDTDRNRRGFAIGAMYRTLSPWVTENPVLLHVTSTDETVVKRAVDQCSEVGIEMIILSFGSGLNMESSDSEYIAYIKSLVDYAHSKGVELGGYSLLASRSAGAEHDVVNPSPIFGNSPCLCSNWGRDYFEKVKNFIEQTGFDLLEHDGSYPGDTCASTSHPGHKCYEDSLYAQWEVIAEFYNWCCERSIYLNVPDWYFLNGANKTAMGYKEVNWSLPRERQVIIGRQNVYDGTWEKLPSMGWMFVPLVEYHGGGKEATLEPLSEHLEHYKAHMDYNFKAGVQACYRGFRAYDTDETKQCVSETIGHYKRYRDILESPIYHLRRPDGKDYDGYLHVNPMLETKAMLVLFNPLSEDIEREIAVPLYYAGISEKARITEDGRFMGEFELSRQYTVTINVKIPANKCVSFEFQ